MTQDQNAAAPTDALLARYHAAQAALDTPEASGPSAQTRAHILDYAAQIATTSGAARAIKEGASGQFDTKKIAAIFYNTIPVAQHGTVNRFNRAGSQRHF